MTMGFENHTNDKVVVWTGEGDLTAVGAGDKLRVSVFQGSIALGVNLSKQEAIYLRNRLTAFIESDIDNAAFREW